MTVNKAQVNENGQVINIAVFSENSIDDGWIEYTNENPAYIGGDYIEGYFYLPQPYPSWTRNTGEWLPPTPKPDGVNWIWNENKLEWEEFSIS